MSSDDTLQTLPVKDDLTYKKGGINLKTKKILSFALGMLILVSVLGMLSTVPATATTSQLDTLTADNVMVAPDKSLPMANTQSTCTLKITDAYGIPNPTGAYAKVVVEGIADGCYKVEVSIYCAGQVQQQTAGVDSSGFWQATFDGTVSECICDDTPLTVKAWCVDPRGVSCSDEWVLRVLRCRDVTKKCDIQIVDVFGVGTVPGTSYVEKIHVRGSAWGCELVEVKVRCNSPYELRARAIVDLATGRWEAILEAKVEAECVCSKFIEVQACCIVPYLPNCCATFKLEQLPCRKPAECEIYIEGLHPELDSTGRLRVIVWGIASGCNKVQVTIICGAKQSATAEVDASGYWKVVLDGSLARCFCESPIYVEACCVDPLGVQCCDFMRLERLPCPEKPPEDCEIKIVDVIGVRRAVAAGVNVHVRGFADGCKIVEVAIDCRGHVVLARTEVDPSSGRWEAIIDGLLAECDCNVRISVKARCVVPEGVECVATFDLDALPCPQAEECQIWIEGVHPELDPDDPHRILRVHVVGGAWGCDKVQVFINCKSNERMETTEVINGYWRVMLDGIVAECFCDTIMTVKACCLDEAGNHICCDELIIERPCPEILPEEECFIRIVDVVADPTDATIGARVHVRGIAQGCKIVEVSIFCGAEVRARAEVDPSTGRWEAILDGLQARCQCNQKITVKACCIIPEYVNCCTYLELPELPCASPEECRIWIDRVFPEYDPDTGQIHKVIVVGGAWGCDKVQVFMTCEGNPGHQEIGIAQVYETGEWKVALDGIVAECFCDRWITVEACCIDEAGNVLCCDKMHIERLPCPEIPPEGECFLEIVKVFGEPMVTAAGVKVHVLGISQGCRMVEVSIDCGGGGLSRARTEVDPLTGRWEAILDGLQAQCQCNQRITVRACCIIPELADCCDEWQLDALPCPPPEECQAWLRGVYWMMAPEDPSQIAFVTVAGWVRGCDSVQMTIKFGDQVMTEIVSLDLTGYGKVTFDVRNIQYPCYELVIVEAYCLNAAGEILCQDTLEIRWPCPEEPPITTRPPEECFVKIEEVHPETMTNDAGEVKLTNLIVVGRAENCRKVEVIVACQERGSKTVEVGPAGEWKVDFTEDELAEMGCVCGMRVEITAICVDPPIDECFDRYILETPCEPITTKPEEPTSSREPEPTESEQPGVFAPGFGLIEAVFAILALLGFAQLRRARR